MRYSATTITAAALAALLAAPLAAQTTLTGVRNLDDRIDDITTEANKDLARQNDAQRFGPNNVPQGWRGSLALSAAATDGRTNTGEISLASRLSYGVGSWNHSVGLAGEYAQTDDVETKREFFGTYEANRYFNDQIYAFGLGRYKYDGFSTEEQDAFIGAGLGYRIINTPTTAWRVQAGPGVRWTKDNMGNSQTEASAIASSRLYVALTDTLSLTNDTDLLYSEQSFVATNDLGLNIKMTDTLSTRFSYRTDYNDAAVEKTENTLGISLVMSF